MTSSPSNPTSVTDGPIWPWLGLTLIAHTSWGAYAVTARYLQTVSNIPTFTLLLFANIPPLLFLVIVFRKRISWRRIATNPLLYLFAFVSVTRSTTNVAAARFTLSIYVQLINQLVPFFVVLLGAWIFRERIPKYTWPAMIACLVGAVMMLSGRWVGAAVPDVISGSDWLGIGLAVVSSLALAVYMLIVRRTASHQRPTSAEDVMVIRPLAAVTLAAAAVPILGEDWRVMMTLGQTDWMFFFAYSLGVLLVASLSQIYALRKIGAPRVSSVMAWRLVVALWLGSLILGEQLTSWVQLAGAGIVFVTVTLYLSEQRKLALGV